MKILIGFALVVMVSFNLLYAQDTLVLKNNSKLVVKVKEVGANEIKYLNFTNLDGPTFAMNTSEIDHVVYSDGFNQRFDVNFSAKSPRDLYVNGQNDAQHFYKGYTAAGTGTLIVSLLSPLAGLVPAIACSSTPPKTKNLEYPDSQMFSNVDYQNGYLKEAKKIKSKNVWKNWGIAFGINLALVLMMQAK